MYYQINETKYWVNIKGEGTPLLLLHGFTGSSLTWDKLSEEWKEHFQVITIDLPGHGKTETNQPFSMESVCRDINLLLELLKINKINLLGYSMGGRTALSFSMYFPQKVRLLMLESASPGLETEVERLNRKQNDDKLAKRIEAEGVESFVNFWEKIPLFHTQEKLIPPVKNLIREERISQSVTGLAASLRGMGTGVQPNWWKGISGLTIPVLLVTGDLDNKFKRIAEKMKTLLPNVEHRNILDAGHAIHVEQPQIFGKIVSDFIFTYEDNKE